MSPLRHTHERHSDHHHDHGDHHPAGAVRHSHAQASVDRRFTYFQAAG